jgi:NodT family efflux transporter outer membrane factor (OMF) lipoprotein
MPGPERLHDHPPPIRAALRHVLMALSTVAILSGCTALSIPSLQPSLPSRWRDTASNAAPTVPTVNLQDWWHTFGDTQLDSLVNRALAGNLDVAQAGERLRAARAAHAHPAAQFLPQLHAKTEDAIDPDATASFFVAGFDATWELGLFGRSQAVRRLADGEIGQADAALRAARVTVVAEVARNWLQLRAAQAATDRLTAVLEARRRIYQFERTRRRLHLSDDETLDQARAALAQAHSALVEPSVAANDAMQALAVLLGQTQPEPAWQQPGRLPALKDWRLAAVPADLLRARPDILKAEAQVLTAAGEAGLAHASKFPNVAIGGSLVWATNLTTHRNTSQHGLGSIGPVIDIPLFDWGLRAAKAKAGDHELQAAVWDYRSAVLQGASEVQTALGRLRADADREQASADALTALDDARNRVEHRVALGLASGLQLSQAVATREQAALSLVQAQAQRGLDFVALFKALGGAPMPGQEQAISREPG